jgi:hypothetical protein
MKSLEALPPSEAQPQSGVRRNGEASLTALESGKPPARRLIHNPNKSAFICG